MISKHYSAVLLAAFALSGVRAQDDSSSSASASSSAAATTAAPGPAFTPLASRSFTYTALPYQADTGTGERGPQQGYNICNSTTENQQSHCQTAIINSLDDFCLWGPPVPNSLIGDVEGEAVAWCTKPGHGTRLIPQGALTGVQFMKTADYVQVTGVINQALINLAPNDDGGEMDPHGADQRGNPLGGLLFSNAYTGDYVQAVEWHNFMGGGVFCLKACDPARPNAARFCEHIFDRIGCAFNAPAKYEEGVFESCLGDNQDFPGIYTGSNGQTSTYTQPAESLGPITVRPYEPRTPASSSCTAFTSAAIYTGLPSVSLSTTASSTRTTTRSTTVRTTTTRASSSSTSSSTGAGFASASAPMKAASVMMGLFALGVVVAF